MISKVFRQSIALILLASAMSCAMNPAFAEKLVAEKQGSEQPLNP